ncbi:MAG: polymer-forming cytoskeletal protein [Candidatus Nitronauta litoralis]|uniref:Polymer-forming cytoskeletal protein n=1 Tax=Candidatus Nitronauta litoralis TaxID=2705533 RepID=A0A7T0G042_9BACT|nr:MAG: polymer-forming cytoskeletal protein [Candidatus Nitronauta litoralis]
MDIPKLMVLTADQFHLLLDADPDGFYDRDTRDQLLRLVQKLENFSKDCSRPEADLLRKHKRHTLGLRFPKGTVSQHTVDISGGMLVEGRHEADAILGGGLVVADTGTVVGKVTAASIVCRGVIKGDIVARGTVHLCANGRIEGNVEAATLQIEDGARFMGHCRLEPELKPKPTTAWNSFKSLLGMGSSQASD